ncbi:MAG: hypothetical protein L0Z55_10325 [Planctomycetes bacterium]|nr:hypothetical protein [Planctomycetota bacterium]
MSESNGERAERGAFGGAREGAPARTPLWGAFHIHTSFSDGGVTLRDTVDAALAAGLDFVVITDHNTLRAREAEGYDQGLLVLADVELTPSPFHNHLLALGLAGDARLQCRGSQERLLSAVEAAGATAWVPHPRGFLNPWLALWNRPWRTWDRRVCGIELATFLVEWAESVRPWNLHRRLQRPLALSFEPDPRTLARWDWLNEQPRPAPAVGFIGIDAHRRSLFGGRIATPSYELLFRTHNLLAWCDPPTGDCARDAAALRAALIAGRFVNVFCSPDEERGLVSFDAHGGALSLRAPERDETELRILRSGQVAARAGGHRLDLAAAPAGIYRAEIRRNGRLWALTNPLAIPAGAGRDAPPAAPAEHGRLDATLEPAEA